MLSQLTQESECTRFDEQSAMLSFVQTRIITACEGLSKLAESTFGNLDNERKSQNEAIQRMQREMEDWKRQFESVQKGTESKGNHPLLIQEMKQSLV